MGLEVWIYLYFQNICDTPAVKLKVCSDAPDRRQHGELLRPVGDGHEVPALGVQSQVRQGTVWYDTVWYGMVMNSVLKVQPQQCQGMVRYNTVWYDMLW